MRTVGLTTAWGLVAAFAVGCGPVVEGTVKPEPNLKPRPLSGQIVKKVLLNNRVLARMLGQPFVARQQAQFGGADALGQRDVPAESADCLGVTAMLQKSVYGSADVQ